MAPPPLLGSSRQEQHLHKRIVGGSFATAYEAPFALLLIRAREIDDVDHGRCAGVLITSKHVLTATYCVLDENNSTISTDSIALFNSLVNATRVEMAFNATSVKQMHQRSTHQKHQQKQQQQKQQKKQQQQQKSLRARLAEEMIRDANDPDAYLLPPVVKIDMRTGLSDLELLNDMAILTLAEPVNFTTTLAPVRISSRVVPELETYTVAGWGQLDNFEFPSFLMKTAVASGRRMDCGIANSMYRGPKGPLICTGRSNGCGLCRGDIGAPLLDIAPNFPRSIKPQKPSNSSSTETAQIVHQQPLTESAFSGGSLGNGYHFILSGVATGYYRPNGLTAVNNDRPMREQGVAWCNGTTMMHYYANPMFDIGWISTVTGVPTKDLTEGDDSFVPDYGTVDDDPNPVGFYWGIGIMCIAALAFMAWMFSRRRKRHRTD